MIISWTYVSNWLLMFKSKQVILLPKPDQRYPRDFCCACHVYSPVCTHVVMAVYQAIQSLSYEDM